MDVFFPRSKWERTRTGGKTALKLGARAVRYWSEKTFSDKQRQPSLKEAFDQESGAILFQGLSLLKGTALKIAQMLSLELDLFPPGMRQELAKACDQVPPMNRALVRKVVQASLGQPPEWLFAHFDPIAFAAASLGQVHRAIARSGEPLAVKIQYPGIQATLRSDIQMVKALLLPFTEYRFLEPALAEIEARLMEETDYLAEARHLAFFKQHLKIDGVKVPTLCTALSTDKVISQSFLSGKPFNAWLADNPSQTDRDLVAQRLYAIFTEGLYGLHCIHADPNPGNFLVGEDLTVGLLDFGCVKRLDPEFVQLYRQLPRVALLGGPLEMGSLIKGFHLLGDDPGPEVVSAVGELFAEMGQWFARLYREAYFDFGAHPEFIQEGKRIGHKTLQIRNYLTTVNTHFIYLHRTRYGLMRLFETMRARVRMWNPHEWEGEAADGT